MNPPSKGFSSPDAILPQTWDSHSPTRRDESHFLSILELAGNTILSQTLSDLIIQLVDSLFVYPFPRLLLHMYLLVTQSEIERLAFLRMQSTKVSQYFDH